MISFQRSTGVSPRFGWPQGWQHVAGRVAQFAKQTDTHATQNVSGDTRAPSIANHLRSAETFCGERDARK